MSMKDLISLGEQRLLHTYNRFPIVFRRGEGVRLYDVDGNAYLDAFSGIGVMALGYAHQGFNDAIKAQLDKITQVSNYFYSEPVIGAAEKFTKASGMDRVFFTNSGAEAVEGALKAARKYAFTSDGRTDHEFIAMERSFHGRSFGALSVTGTKNYRDPFEPLLGPAHFAKFNDLESVKSFINDRTCAIIMECVQGEGGVNPASDEFINGVRKLCDEKGILLIFDEVQCGMGRTGEYFAWQKYGVKPDIMTAAKALGCGLPVGAFAMTEKVAEKSLMPGDHGSTQGGNPLSCAAVNAVFDIYEKEDVIGNVRRLTPYMEKKLDEVALKHECVKERRGLGFLQALEFDGPVAALIDKAKEYGVIFINAGANVLRIIPPLVFNTENIDEMCDVIDKALAKL